MGDATFATSVIIGIRPCILMDLDKEARLPEILGGNNLRRILEEAKIVATSEQTTVLVPIYASTHLFMVSPDSDVEAMLSKFGDHFNMSWITE